jgi:hypothetical protein
MFEATGWSALMRSWLQLVSVVLNPYGQQTSLMIVQGMQHDQ